MAEQQPRYTRSKNAVVTVGSGINVSSGNVSSIQSENVAVELDNVAVESPAAAKRTRNVAVESPAAANELVCSSGNNGGVPLLQSSPLSKKTKTNDRTFTGIPLAKSDNNVINNNVNAQKLVSNTNNNDNSKFAQLLQCLSTSGTASNKNGNTAQLLQYLSTLESRRTQGQLTVDDLVQRSAIYHDEHNSDRAVNPTGIGKNINKERAAAMSQAMKNHQLEYESTKDQGRPIFNRIDSSSSSTVESKKSYLRCISRGRKEELSLGRKALAATGAITQHGAKQPKRGEGSFPPPLHLSIIVNSILVKEGGLQGLNPAFPCIIKEFTTGKVIGKTSSIAFSNANGPYNSPENSIYGKLGERSIDSQKITVTHILKCVKEKMPIRIYFSVEPCTLEVFMETEIGEEEEKLFNVLKKQADKEMAASAPWSSRGEVEVYSADVCSADTEGSIKAGNTSYTKGSFVKKYVSLQMVQTENDTKTRFQGKHGYAWEPNTSDRPLEYMKIHKLKGKNLTVSVLKKYPDGMLWKQKDGTFFWIKLIQS